MTSVSVFKHGQVAPISFTVKGKEYYYTSLTVEASALEVGSYFAKQEGVGSQRWGKGIIVFAAVGMGKDAVYNALKAAGVSDKILESTPVTLIRTLGPPLAGIGAAFLWKKDVTDAKGVLGFLVNKSESEGMTPEQITRAQELFSERLNSWSRVIDPTKGSMPNLGRAIMSDLNRPGVGAELIATRLSEHPEQNPINMALEQAKTVLSSNQSLAERDAAYLRINATLQENMRTLLTDSKLFTATQINTFVDELGNRFATDMQNFEIERYNARNPEGSKIKPPEGSQMSQGRFSGAFDSRFNDSSKFTSLESELTSAYLKPLNMVRADAVVVANMISSIGCDIVTIAERNPAIFEMDKGQLSLEIQNALRQRGISEKAINAARNQIEMLAKDLEKAVGKARNGATPGFMSRMVKSHGFWFILAGAVVDVGIGIAFAGQEVSSVPKKNDLASKLIGNSIKNQALRNELTSIIEKRKDSVTGALSKEDAAYVEDCKKIYAELDACYSALPKYKLDSQDLTNAINFFRAFVNPEILAPPAGVQNSSKRQELLKEAKELSRIMPSIQGQSATQVAGTAIANLLLNESKAIKPMSSLSQRDVDALIKISPPDLAIKLAKFEAEVDSVKSIETSKRSVSFLSGIGVTKENVYYPSDLSSTGTSTSSGVKTSKNYPTPNSAVTLGNEKIAVWSVYTVSAVQGKTDYGNLGYLNTNYDEKYAAKDQFGRPYNPKGPGGVVEIIDGKVKIRDDPATLSYRSDIEIPMGKSFNYVTVYDKKNDKWTDYIDASCVPGAKPEDGMVKFREGKMSDLLDNKNANLVVGKTHTNDNGKMQSKTRIQIVTSDPKIDATQGTQ